MVFIGRWRSRRGYGPHGGGYGPGGGYGRGYGRGGSCMRDMFLLEGGCCIAELLGCGSQLVLVTPSLVRRSLRSTRQRAPGAPAGNRHSVRRLLLAAIELYQAEISPELRPCCRYSPTCSHYARQALDAHGSRRGLWLVVRRLLRCRPGAAGGFDPVPPLRGT